MKKILLFLFALLTGSLSAQTYNIPAGASAATINSTLSSAAAYTGGPVTVNVAAGTSSGLSGITVPCSNQPMTLTGPVTVYPQTFSGYSNIFYSNPTAKWIGSGIDGQIVSVPACSVQRTIQYLEIDGNRPASGGGGIYVAQGNNHLTIQYMYIHGNEEIYPEPCDGSGCSYGRPTFLSPDGHSTFCNTCQYYNYDTTGAELIEMDGSFDGTATNQQNITIQYNLLGNPQQSYPTSQWVGSSTSNLGVAVSNGDCVNVQQWLFGPGPQNTSNPNQASNIGYDSTGGNCAGIGLHGGSTNLLIQDNMIRNQEQGMKFFECGSSTSTECIQVNDLIQRNDISGTHRMGIEAQQTPADTGVGVNNFLFQFNSFHDSKDASYGSWIWSIPQGGVQRNNANSNLGITDCGGSLATSGYCTQGHGGPNYIEWWGSNGTTANYNLFQNLSGSTTNGGVSWGFGGYSGTSGCPSGAASTTCWQAVYNTAEGLPGSVVQSEGEETNSPPLIQNNVTNSTATTKTANAPILPASTSFTGSKVITLSIAQFGNTTALPQGNQNIWYTTDGSTPAPHSGTTKFYTAPFTITTTTTVKAVGMWGGVAQPAAYSSGTGFTPSTVQTATYTTSTGPALTGCFQSNSGGVNTLTVGATVQQIGNCTYASGTSPLVCSPSADANGNMITAWGTSSSAILTVSSSGLVTAVAAGTASSNATATGGTSCSAYSFTVSNPTLTGVTISLQAGGSSISVGQNAQTCANMTYSGGATTQVCGTGTDRYGTTPSAYTSTATSVASMSSVGVLKGLTLGTTNINVTAGRFTSANVPITVSPAGANLVFGGTVIVK